MCVYIYIWSHNGGDMIKDVEQTKHLLKKNKNHVFWGTWWRYTLP